jgi:hypothetical protein
MFDISVNCTFKIGMRAKWENWMSCGEKSFTATGRLRRATYLSFYLEFGLGMKKLFI